MRHLLTILAILLPLLCNATVVKLTNYTTMDQDDITTRTGYHYICGPTTAAEMFTYWASHGYPKLMYNDDVTLPSYAVPDNSTQSMAVWDHIVVNHTSYDGSYTYLTATHLSKMRSYFTENGYDATFTEDGMGSLTFSEIKTQIDAGRPIMFLSYQWGHWVLIIGYDDSTESAIILWGHDEVPEAGLGYHEYEVTVPIATLTNNWSTSQNVGSNGGTDAVFVVPAATSYSVGGTVSNLTQGELVLSLDGSATYSITSNGAKTYFTSAAEGSHVVTIQSNPMGQKCTLSNSSFSLTANVTNVNVNCVESKPSRVSGRVSGGVSR